MQRKQGILESVVKGNMRVLRWWRMKVALNVPQVIDLKYCNAWRTLGSAESREPFMPLSVACFGSFCLASGLDSSVSGSETTMGGMDGARSLKRALKVRQGCERAWRAQDTKGTQRMTSCLLHTLDAGHSPML